MERTLGIDVGFAILGWGVVEKNANTVNKLQMVDYGVIVTDKDMAMQKRLEKIFDELNEVIIRFQPTHIAIESLFYFKNQTTVMSVSQARGVALLAIAKQGLDPISYTPLQVKSAVTGYGRADKQQIQNMVKAILGLSQIPKPDDAADALAIAITHLNTYSLHK